MVFLKKVARSAKRSCRVHHIDEKCMVFFQEKGRDFGLFAIFDLRLILKGRLARSLFNYFIPLLNQCLRQIMNYEF